VVIRFYKVIALDALSKAGNRTFDKKETPISYSPTSKSRYLKANFAPYHDSKYRQQGELPVVVTLAFYPELHPDHLSAALGR